MTRLAILLTGLLAFGAPAAANDSSAVLGAGGLVLTQNDVIVLEQEDLFLSRAEVRVAYRFRNTSDRDVETLVAFPMPVLDVAALSESDSDVPVRGDPNYLEFRTTVDGRPVVAEMEQKASFEGQDVTALLLAKGLKLSVFDPGYEAALTGMAPADAAVLAARRLVDMDETGHATHGYWMEQTTWFWRQVFPAGAVTEVRHRYRPVVGHRFFTAHDLDEPELSADLDRQHCVDPPTRRALRQKLARTGQEPGLALLMAHQVDYVLVTANNWAGPIGRFTLTLDKGDPVAILSLCIDGLVKTGPTTFTGSWTNYVPDRDLSLLIVE
ncbi:DUF4424 family protein [Zavarzinia sp. CC-PAN008]|uniref:DUF4424 family protein n=1 Tax=Zavarzinia sp. CC-PAN008 TaxID=3243332 RepID=UPI003F7480AC